MATRMPPDDKDAAGHIAVGTEEDIAELLVALRQQMEATKMLVNRTGGLLREIDVHQRHQPPHHTPKR